ncbi:MAG: zinc ribbon domain-containing protein [Acidobacteria bacterium]|nr:zinc ribbon domain-containing protein [Acidobacteriota bacterium]MCI0666180.1 zinc ribbon domain-containing protein [Acidobacteriota bacterium]
MFCPNCGRENPIERKFCVSCGTNLEAVSQALSGSSDDFFTKTDNALDQFLAKYAEHVFKDAPASANDRTIIKSWRILGQSILTSFVDLILFSLMWNILPLRFIILLISTPFKLVSRRSSRQEVITGEIVDSRTMGLPEPLPNRGLPSTVSSITEQTTEKFPDRLETRQKEVANLDASE